MTNLDDLLNSAHFFHSLSSTSDEEILNQIAKEETFAAKKKLAESHFEHLSSGSSRIVLLTKEKRVIKLAKNDRGIAQNKVEANPKMKSKFLNPITKHADNYSWIETYYLEKITTKRFEELTHITFADFEEAIGYGLKNVSSNNSLKKPSHFDQVKETPIYKEMKRIGEEFKLLPGDIVRISSWGEKDDHPVLIDAGLNSSVFEKYYDSSTSSASETSKSKTNS